MRLPVIVDAVDAEGATCRSMVDAPEIDGNLFIDAGFDGLAPGDLVTVEVEEAGDFDLWGQRVASEITNRISHKGSKPDHAVTDK